VVCPLSHVRKKWGGLPSPLNSTPKDILVRMTRTCGLLYFFAIITLYSVLRPSWALMQVVDFEVRVLNSTQYTIQVCNSKSSGCATLPPGKSFEDEAITNGYPERMFGVWRESAIVKICGETLPVSAAADYLGVERTPSKAFYRFEVSTARIEKSCLVK